MSYTKLKPGSNTSVMKNNENQRPISKPQLQKDAITTQKAKPRGGWDDDDGYEPQLKTSNGGPYGGNQSAQQENGKNIAKSPLSSTSSKSEEIATGQETKKPNPTISYEIKQIDELFLSKHEFENKTINDLIQPSGARLKQPDNVLNDFCKACESFQAAVAGSLLLSKLYEEIPFVSKARDLFLIEVLVKKVKKYYEFFKHNINILKGLDFSNEGTYSAQLTKITDDIVKYIENPEKPKPKQNTIPTTTSQSTSNVLEETDLLGGASQAKAKQDPFDFLKKPAPDSTYSQTNKNFELLDLEPTSLTSGSQITTSQSKTSSNQPQAQTKKFNPFDLGTLNKTPTQISNQETNKQPSSLPGNFKKFQASTAFNDQNSNIISSAPVNVGNNQNISNPSPFDQLDDLLESFSGLDFSGNKVEPQVLKNQTAPINHQGQIISGQNIQGSHQVQFGSPANLGFSNSQNQGLSSGPHGSQIANQHNPQFYGGAPTGSFGTYPGYPSHPQWATNYPQGHSQLPFGQHSYSNPQNLTGNSGFGSTSFQGNFPKSNSFQSHQANK